MAGAWEESTQSSPSGGNALRARTERMPAGTLGPDKDHRMQGRFSLPSSPRPGQPRSCPMEPEHDSPSPFSPQLLLPASSLLPQ